MLLGNYSVHNRNPIRYLGGGLATPEVNHQSNFNRGGAKKNRQYVEQTTAANKQFSLPYGYYESYTWQMPQVGGDLSARRTADFSLDATGAGVLGLPTEGTATFTIVFADADGQLISSGIGSAALTFTTNTPVLTASLNAIGAADFTITSNTPILGAEASLLGTSSFVISTNTPVVFPLNDSSPLRTATATITFTGGMTPYAIGIMEGTTEEAGLTNAGIANSVWNSFLSNYTEAGSAGKALATASSGGVDLVAMAQAILDAAELTPIHANVKKMNSANLLGTGVEADKWRGSV